ncbi:MAG: hypothetical protein LH647_15890 [Leptolyngbyaceae cyanobacterium CAN_BIN12]|nr:hypothetical protein [Leptolyngbyaceae cyanobacterium CAN_BIN12]
MRDSAEGYESFTNADVNVPLELFLESVEFAVSRFLSLFITIGLYILGIALVMLSILVVLKGLGWVTKIPDYLAWALTLFAIGGGILGGLRSLKP